MNKLALYFRLVRADKPIGILLLLWPTLWALWMASGGKPDPMIVVIFVLGTALMRSAGCAINDYADRDFDKHVKRTVDRPLTSGRIKGWEAVMVAAVLAIVSFLLILPLNTLTKQLSVLAVIVAGTYPYFKRFFAIPRPTSASPSASASRWPSPPCRARCRRRLVAAGGERVLGRGLRHRIRDGRPRRRPEDRHPHLGHHLRPLRRAAVMLCYGAALAIDLVCGWMLGLRWWFVAGVVVAAGMALYHYTLIRDRDRMRCFAAFRHNNWLGAALFFGVALDYALG
jgi:4-hydroxybenzoate polyprenyltransferase